jgi:predicted nucleic acid-binding protein
MLDTNAMVALGDATHPIFTAVEREISHGARCSTNSVAWHEFVRGPLSESSKQRLLWILESRILPLDQEDAEIAALLFNRTGRKRASTADCLIAASALRRKQEIVTLNIDDFQPFIPFGLRLLNL